MYFLLTRPQEDSDRLAKSLIALGHSVACEPLLKIDNLDREEIDPNNFQAILFTSANGVRSFARHYKVRTIPCYAVGQATAAEAGQAGFQPVFTAGGDVDKLTNLIVRDLAVPGGPLLHISGKDTAGNLSGLLAKAGFQVTRHPLYKATKAAVLSQKTQALISAGKITHLPFYSPRTAKTFVDLIQKANLQNNLSEITALCLSSAVSNVINSLVWHRILTAAQPDQFSLFKLIDVMLEENR